MHFSFEFSRDLLGQIHFIIPLNKKEKQQGYPCCSSHDSIIQVGGLSPFDSICLTGFLSYADTFFCFGSLVMFAELLTTG